MSSSYNHIKIGDDDTKTVEVDANKVMGTFTTLPNFYFVGATSGTVGQLLNFISGWEMNRYALPFDFRLYGFTVTVEDEGNGNTLQFNVLVNSTSVVSDTTTSNTFNDYDSKVLDIDNVNGYVEFTKGQFLYVKCHTGNGLVEVVLTPYGKAM